MRLANVRINTHVYAFYFGAAGAAEVTGLVQGNDPLALTGMLAGVGGALIGLAVVAIPGLRSIRAFGAEKETTR
jgi:hypothetical protein